MSTYEKTKDQLGTEILGELLIHFRKRAGKTQSDAANSISATQSYISKIENGQLEVSLLDAIKLLKSYNSDLVEFLLVFDHLLQSKEDKRLVIKELIKKFCFPSAN